MSNRPRRDHERRTYYTLYTPNPDADAATHVAKELGARFEGPVGELDQYFWISVPKGSISERSLDDEQDDLQRLFQRLRTSSGLQKRSNQPIDRVTRLDRQTPRKKLYKRSVIPVRRQQLEVEVEVEDELATTDNLPVLENIQAEQISNHEVLSSASFLNQAGGFDALRNALGIYDPGFDQQWHLINQEQRGHDINVTGVWSQGVTGENIVVAILDDGLDMDSDDLKDNFFAAGSYDFNARTALPKPQLEDDRHGTRCAGEIAAARNNVCGVGVAYGAKVAGIRILSEDITDADEAEALNYAYQQNHIFSCSWGPPDLGEVVEAPQEIVLDAIKNGITKGRNGSGTIYVFASGNGGSNDDNCNYDGYTNSMYTITVGAIDRMENHPYYSERCSAQLVVTYSSGSGGHIYTTDVGQNECYDRHGGTSAAAPLAAGIFALVLSVRPDLTWRDMQYLCVETAVPISLDDPDWTTLPSGRMYNHKFGYGKLDAYAIVERAKTFESVRPQTYLQIPLQLDEPQLIPDLTEINAPVDKSRALTSTISITDEWIAKSGLGRLEHVTATVYIEHSRRGDLETLLESPNNVVSQLGAPRKFDTSPNGLINWTFMTVKHWGENPVGNWTLRVIDGKNPQYTGVFVNWTLTLWGELAEGFGGEPIHAPLSVVDYPKRPLSTSEQDLAEDKDDVDADDVLPSMETEISTIAIEHDTTTTTPTYMHMPTLIDPFDDHNIVLKDDLPIDDYRSFFAYTLVVLILVAGAIATVFLVRRRVFAGYFSVQQQDVDRIEFEEINRERVPKVKRQSISNSKNHITS